MTDDDYWLVAYEFVRWNSYPILDLWLKIIGLYTTHTTSIKRLPSMFYNSPPPQPYHQMFSSGVYVGGGSPFSPFTLNQWDYRPLAPPNPPLPATVVAPPSVTSCPRCGFSFSQQCETKSYSLMDWIRSEITATCDRVITDQQRATSCRSRSHHRNRNTISGSPLGTQSSRPSSPRSQWLSESEIPPCPPSSPAAGFLSHRGVKTEEHHPDVKPEVRIVSGIGRLAPSSHHSPLFSTNESNKNNEANTNNNNKN